MDYFEYSEDQTLFVYAQILMEDTSSHWLNPNMKEVVRAKVVKWLNAGIVYPILIVHGLVWLRKKVS